MASTKTLLSTAASVVASAMLVRAIANDFVPRQVHDFIYSGIATLLGRFSSQLTIVIDEYQNFSINQMYKAAEIYLATKISPSTRRLKVAKQEGEKAIEITMERGEEVVDMFGEARFVWRLITREKQQTVYHSPNGGGAYPSVQYESRWFELSFHKKHKDKAFNSYLPYILEQSKAMKEEERTLKIHTAKTDHFRMYGNRIDVWTSVNLRHPATFDMVAMDPELKQAVLEDLGRFVRRKDYYKRVGKAWKRGYLLYGPPGTGKSSLIAAMANYLKFDIYDLELTEIRCNSDLRKLLVATANRSILVVEDIDCTIELEERNAKTEPTVYVNGHPRTAEKVTLSGLLNFIDGLWSSCGDERIIVFTTNHKERLDAALLRPGRMDMHINMSYCSASSFRVLAFNYHGVDDHPLFQEIEELIREVEVTPAEVAEELMKSDDLDVALKGLIKFIRGKKLEAAEAKAKQEKSSFSSERSDKIGENSGEDQAPESDNFVEVVG